MYFCQRAKTRLAVWSKNERLVCPLHTCASLLCASCFSLTASRPRPTSRRSLWRRASSARMRARLVPVGRQAPLEGVEMVQAGGPKQVTVSAGPRPQAGERGTNLRAARRVVFSSSWNAMRARIWILHCRFALASFGFLGPRRPACRGTAGSSRRTPATGRRPC